MGDAAGDRDRNHEGKRRKIGQGHRFQIGSTSQAHHELLSSAVSPSLEQKPLAVNVGLNILYTGEVLLPNATLGSSSASGRPLASPPALHQWPAPTISAMVANNVTVANLEDGSVEQRVEFPMPFGMRSRQSSSDSSRSKSGGSSEFEAVRTSSKTHSTAKNMLRSSSIKRTRTSLTAADQAYQQKKPPSKGIPELDMSLPFPAKLHYIISNPKYNEYINWCPHGRAWKVLKQTEFERYIIPIFFRSDKSHPRMVPGQAHKVSVSS
jgi:HSF-type DNA-binding